MLLYATIALAVMLALFALQLHTIIANYKIETGTPWQRFLAAFSHSETILVARVGAFLAAAYAWITSMLPTFDPSSEVGSKLVALIPPQHVPYYMFGFALLIEWVRRRASSIDRITPPPAAVVIQAAPAVPVIPPVPPLPAVEDNSNALIQ